MLVSLYVKNFAIIDNIQVDFKEGMSVLTGETGAGKSLIIDAIGLLFGKRASPDWVRYGETKATIEGVFSNFHPKMQEIIGFELDPEEYLVLKREIYSNGKSLCKVNNETITLAQLFELSETIGDIHSQFDTQGLFNPKNYLQFLDDATITHLLDEYRIYLSEYEENEKKYRNLLEKNREDTERLDFLKFQLNELDRINPSVEEEEDLKARSHYLNNFGTVSSNLSEIIDLYEKNNLLDKIYESVTLLEKLVTFDSRFENLKKQIEAGYYDINDALAEISLEFKKLDFDGSELDSINARLSTYSDLRRKYRKTTEEIVKYRVDLKNELNNIENYDILLAELEKNVKKSYDKTMQIAKNISEKRKKNAKDLETQILENLADLQLKNVEFRIDFNNDHKFRKNGIDEVDFMITFNKGEPLKSLSKTASGGEMSRFMLALKTLVSKKLDLQTIIFDEIDNGVSGAIAYSIASKLKSISERSQVLCVTHIPQVAAISEHHYRIQKKIAGDKRTTTEIVELDYDGRVIEIAKMISNGVVTDASKNLAIELLKK
ncbi:MAG TPA: DNA repair protein RecN [Acholeplasmataceae bacterium]|nr:DNA repair protein RecN [Acholeplasmataceae bacterium]